MQYTPRGEQGRMRSATELFVGQMLEGNLMTSGVPNDNDIAISDEGFVVSVINSNMFMYDTEADTLMKSITLGAFIVSLNITSSKYDPKIVYDPVKDRFVLVFLTGTTYQNSRIIVAFSSTSNPVDPWNLYVIGGNPLSNNTWSDYPVIGISNMDLFIGINTFFNGSTNNSGFYESCFWQVNLADGYLGNPLSTAYYHDIAAPNDTLFNITPIHRGAENTEGDMFLLSNKNLALGSDSVYILHIDSPLALGNPQLSLQLVRSNRAYGLPPSAQQPGGHFFDTNDSRVLGGFQVGSTIQFVQCSVDTARGLSAIYHGFIYDVYSNPFIRANLITDTTRFLGYPNIAWTSLDTNDCRAIISFNYVSATEPGGTGAVLFRSDSTYSDFITLKTGNSLVNVIAGTDERWGDYSGIQRRYNEPCRIWCAGTFAKTTSSNGTWIAEIGADSLCATNPFTAIDEIQDSPSRVFPNPAIDLTTIEFNIHQSAMTSIRLYDQQGKLIALLFEDKVKSGLNRIQFNMSTLPSGIYYLDIRTSAGEHYSEKIIRS
jgi:hypothetical protein